jgi:hypothetical protein
VFPGVGAQGRNPRRREVQLVEEAVVREQWSVVSLLLLELTALGEAESFLSTDH